MNTALAYLHENRERLGLERYGIPARLSSLVLTPRFQASRHVVFLLMAEGASQPALVAKLPRLVDTNTSLTREAASLAAVQGLRPAGFDSVPRLVAFEPSCGRSILVETALAGPSMSPDVVRRESDRCCALAVDWLLDLHASSARPAGADWFSRLVDQPLDAFASIFPLQADEVAMIERTRSAVEPLRSARIPFVCEHGDLSHPNLILTSPDTLGVVDWELAQMDGQPIYDLFVFLVYVAFSRNKAQAADGHLSAFREAFFGPGAWATRVARTYAQRAQLPIDLLSPLFVLTWARYTTILLSRLADSNPDAPGTVSAQDAAWLRTNRYYRLWLEAITNLSRLTWAD